MSIDGLWTGELYGLQGWENSGVVVLEHGRALGGGRHHFAVGSYEVSGDEFKLLLSIEYHGPPRTLFGSSAKTLQIQFDGTVDGGRIEGSVCRPESPELSLMFRLTRRAEIS